MDNAQTKTLGSVMPLSVHYPPKVCIIRHIICVWGTNICLVMCLEDITSAMGCYCRHYKSTLDILKKLCA